MQWDVQLVLLLALLGSGAILWWNRRTRAATAPAGPAPSRSMPGAGAASGAAGEVPAPPAALQRSVPYARALFPVLLAVLLVRTFVIEPYRIPTGSMVPTLAVGDYVFVSKFAYGLRLPVLHWRILPFAEPRHGDVMVFVPPHESRYFIKRVVGLPGDRVRYVAGELFVNGQRVDVQVDGRDDATDGVQQFIEDLDGTRHLVQRFIGMRSREGEWLVPEDRYFMLGDNRDMSEDSRYWGYVAGEHIVGRAVAIWAHKQPGWSLPTFARNGVIH